MEANEQLLDDSSPKRRKSKTVFRLKAAGVALVVTVGAVWLVRIPLMNLAIRGYLDAQGINATFEGDGISFARVELEELRLGPAKNPDLTAERAEVYLDWDGFSPKVESVVLENPVLNARVDQTGVSLGSLDLFRAAPTDEPFALPQLGLTVREGRVNVATPFGTVIAYVQTEGQVNRDFTLSLRARSVPAPGQPELLEGLIFTGSAAVQPGGITAHLEGGAASVNAAGLVDGLRTGAFRFESEVKAAPDFTRLSALMKGTAERVIHTDGTTDDIGASAVAMAVNLNDVRLTPQFRPTAWDGTASLTAAAARAGSLQVQRPHVEASFTGTRGRGSGDWSVAAGALEWPGIRLGTIGAKGDLKVEMGDAAPIVAANGTLDIADGALGAHHRASLRQNLARLENTPLAGLASQSANTLDRALQNFHASAPLSLTWGQGIGELLIPGAVEVRGRGGVNLVVLDHEEPALRLELPSGKTVVSGRASLAGPGLPKLEALVDRLSMAPGAALESTGTVVVDAWKAGGSSLSLTPVTYTLVQNAGKGEVALSGNARISGPIPGGRIEDLQLPLDVEAAWDNGLRLAARDKCLDVKIGGFSIGDYRFGRGTMPVCPQGDKGFLWTSPEGKLTGGATAGELRLALLGTDGAASGNGGNNGDLGLRAGPIALAVRGTTERPVLGLDFRQATLRLADGITARSSRIHGTLTGGTAGWRGNGQMDGFSLVASEAAVRAEAKGSWRADFNNDAAPLQLTGLSGRVVDTGKDARFQPLAFTDGEARAGGQVASLRGNVRLEETGDLLGEIEARHDTDSDAGDLMFRLTGLTFSPTLQPYMLTEAARGVVENVTGTVGGFVRARWTPTQMQTDGAFDLNALSMATGSLGPVEGVSGRVVLTDFLGMKTPPGQTVTVARVNPGVAMENGEFRFQLLGDQQLKLERAGWPLADGELLVDPTVISLAAPEKKVNLRVSEVDLEKFVGLMNMESLKATGEVEGELPLVVSRQGAAIRNGYLRTKGSGTLSYTGPVPDAEGNAKLAFDALKNFKFNSIVLDVDGDLAGEIATGIRFEGTSQASLSPLSWFRALRTRGIPFKFNINVKAPLRSLMSSISGVSDVGSLVRRSVEMELEKTNGKDDADSDDAESKAGETPETP